VIFLLDYTFPLDAILGISWRQKYEFFATQAPVRPDPIRPAVSGVSFLHGTPLLDTMPQFPAFDCLEVPWARWHQNKNAQEAVADARFEKTRKIKPTNDLFTARNALCFQ
jgi:hypothetical protein